MKQSVKTGMTFGITSGIITTLGLLVGLSFGSGIKAVVIGGIITIAFADAFSDALGIFVSEESDKKNKIKDIWSAGISTFFAKFLITIMFVVPFLFLDIFTATIISTIWGLLGLSFLSYKIAKMRNQKPSHVIFEHIMIAGIVIVITYFVGIFVSKIFGA